MQLVPTLFAPRRTSPVPAGLLDGALEYVSGKVVSVKDYAFGALGDGVTNDTGACQAAINYVASLGGGRVFFPRGIYLTDGLIVPNFVQLVGEGEASLLRARGNNFSLRLSPGHRSKIADLAFDATSTQSSGGAIDFTNAGSNIRLRDLYFGSRLYYGLYVAPQLIGGSPQGIYTFSGLRWNGVAGNTNAIRIGDGANLVTDINISDVSGTAASAVDMNTWVTVRNKSDTVRISNATFFGGGGGPGSIVIGEPAGTPGVDDVTQMTMNNVCIDSYSGYGLNVGRCQDLRSMLLAIQSCTNGMNLGAEVNLLRFMNGTSRNNAQWGAIVQAGAKKWHLLGFDVYDNNQGNTAFPNGLELVGVSSDWSVEGSDMGNGVLVVSGHQRKALVVPASACDGYTITNNRFFANPDGGLADAGTAPTVGKTVSGNKTS